MNNRLIIIDQLAKFPFRFGNFHLWPLLLFTFPKFNLLDTAYGKKLQYLCEKFPENQTASSKERQMDQKPMANIRNESVIVFLYPILPITSEAG